MNSNLEKIAFIGNKSENIQFVEELILEVLRDHAYWRRNFHPEDEPVISESDKAERYIMEKKELLRQNLNKVLSDLKNGVPFYSTRNFGHMTSDISIPGLIGFFATMLYNQNNVAREGASVTVEHEMDYVSALIEMVGYKKFQKEYLANSDLHKETSWGHLSSGGSVANLEALWVARNIKFFPLGLYLSYKVSKKESTFYTLSKESKYKQILEKLCKDLPASSFELLNYTNEKTYELYHNFLQISEFVFGINIRDNPDKEIRKNFINNFERNLLTIQNIGLIDFWKLCNENKLEFETPKVFIPKTAHYCWWKNLEILGLGKSSIDGKSAIFEINVDKDFKMTKDAVAEEIQKLKKISTTTLAIVGVCGATEEGAVDDLKGFVNLRDEYQKNQYSFWLHSDAAWGGYFATLKSYYKKRSDYNNFPIEDFESLNDFDSIVIDPHKLGYIPYPGGAVLYKDSRIRNHITSKAPYVGETEEDVYSFLGKWTVEGSRPGASAVSCYLSEKVFPLKSDGHGILMKKCIEATEQLNSKFVSFISKIQNKDKSYYDFKIVKLYEPQLNVSCYVVASEKYLKSVKALKKMNDKIIKKLYVSKDTYHANFTDYLVSHTEYKYSEYQSQIDDLLGACGVARTENDGEDFQISVIRTVTMMPLLADDEGQIDRFVKCLFDSAKEFLPIVQVQLIHDLVQELVQKKKDSRRIKVLLVEDEDQERNSLKFKLEMEYEVSKCFDIIVSNNFDDAKEKIENSFNSPDKYPIDAFIFDLCLPKFEEGPLESNGGLKLIDLIRNKKKESLNTIIVYSQYLSNNIEKSKVQALGIEEEKIILKNKEKRALDYISILHGLQSILSNIREL